MALLSILSLGALQFSLDGTPIDGFTSNKARALLLYLAVESRQTHPREKLAGLFWPEYPEQNARHTLSQTLSNLRSVIGDLNRDADSRFLQITRQTIQFNENSDYWLDVDQFSKLSKSQNTHQAISSYEQAIHTYRGHFLDGFSVNGTPVFEEWALMQRERWHRVACQILIQLIEGYSNLGAYDKGLYYAWQLLELDPWREDAHRKVMQLLYGSGQRTAALAQYEACSQILQDELGAQPEPETVGLYEAIKAGSLGVTSIGKSPPEHPGLLISPHNLPAQLTPCIGRDEEILTLKRLLINTDCRLLTLVGPGGIGKTRLALEAVSPLVQNFAYGAFIVTLTPLLSAQGIIPTIAQTLGYTFSEKGGSQEQQFLNYLKNKDLLLILDNVEHLLREQTTETDSGTEPASVSTVIISILEAAPGVKILVTSRARLNILGEYLFPVRILAYPLETIIHMDEVRNLAAVHLFVQSARSLRPDFELRESNVQAVSAICRYVQGIPLAILLTTSWITTLSIQEIAERLKPDDPDDPGRGLDLLQTDWSNVMPRHRSLRVVFEHSWRLLTEHEQNVCQALSVFCGGCSATEAFQVAGATLQNLRTLVNTSFLERASSGRYTMQELLRQYVMEKLIQDNVKESKYRNLHCVFYRQALQRWFEDSKGPRQQDVLAEMDLAIENARLAWDWAVAQDNIVHIDNMVQGLCLYYHRRFRKTEGEAACRTAIEKLETIEDLITSEPGERLRVLCKVLTWRSVFLPYEQAREVINQSLDLLEREELAAQDVREEKAAVFRQMGEIMMRIDRGEAKRFFEQSLALYRAIQAAWEEGQVLESLGTLAWAISEYKSSRQYYVKGLAIAQELADLRGMAWATRGLSAIAMTLGNLEEGVRLSSESLNLRRELGDLAEIADGLYSLGFKYISLGRSADAIPLLEECKILTCDQLGLPGGYVHSVLAWARMLMGHYKQAQPLGETALQIMQKNSDPRGVAWTYHVLGGIALGLAEFGEAEPLLRASVKTYRPLEQRQELTMALSYLSYTLWAQGCIVEAKQLGVEVLNIWKVIGSPQSLMFGLVGMALISLMHDAVERALELYALASTLSPCLENCAWFWDVAERHINTMAASLSPDAVTAAQERGRALNIQATVDALLQM